MFCLVAAVPPHRRALRQRRTHRKQVRTPLTLGATWQSPGSAELQVRDPA